MRLTCLSLLLCLFAFPVAVSAQSADLYITSTYERFRDQTRVQLVYPIVRDKDLTISLLALGIHKGKQPTEQPPVVIIGMYFQATKGRVAPGNRELLALADDAPLDFGVAQRLQVDGLRDDEKSAAFGAVAPYADVRTLAEARKAEFKFFGVTGRLPSDAQRALDAFVRRLRP